MQSDGKKASFWLLLLPTSVVVLMLSHLGIDYPISQQIILLHMWQSRVEIEGYSVAHVDRIAVFEAPYRWTFC